MKIKLIVLWIIFICLLGMLSTFVCLIFIDPNLLLFFLQISEEYTSEVGMYFLGLAGILISLTSLLFVFITFQTQKTDYQKNQTESNFFKMLDYHNEIVKNLNVEHISIDKPKSEGRRAFVIFRIQLKKILDTVEKIDSDLKLGLSKKQIIDLSYLVFYYGIDDESKDFLQSKIPNEFSIKFINKLLEYKGELFEREHINIGRTNQTSLSAYFRNMYNAIKLVSDNKLMSQNEKKRLIEILRAQLSNPELYVLFFNVVSRFGKKWLEEENDFIIEYEFIKNLPLAYCGDYSPKEFFKMEYEDEELAS